MQFQRSQILPLTSTDFNNLTESDLTPGRMKSLDQRKLFLHAEAGCIIMSNILQPGSVLAGNEAGIFQA